MPYGATTLIKHVVEVRHVIWMNKIQNVWRIGKILISKIWWWMVFSSGGALLWRRGVLLLMLTNKGWADGNGSNPSGGFRKPRGGCETRRGGDGLEGPGGGATWVGVGDSLGDDEEVKYVLLLEIDFDRA
nr:hypothetical protein [Tanacetum cinerariifolium]